MYPLPFPALICIIFSGPAETWEHYLIHILNMPLCLEGTSGLPRPAFTYDRYLYLCCYELFQPLNSHSSPQDSSDSGEARVIPGGRDEKRRDKHVGKDEKGTADCGRPPKSSRSKRPWTQ